MNNQTQSVFSNTGGRRVLLIVPPFAGLDRPALGVHLLQACLAQSGIKAAVYYANFDLASVIGEHAYEGICYSATSALLGERFFAAAAYGVAPLGRADEHLESAVCELSGKLGLTPQSFRALESLIEPWVRATADKIAAAGYDVVGCSTTFEQTAASIAIVQALKAIKPELVTVMGGANCESEMADGIAALSSSIDYIFSGESERTFPPAVEALLKGESLSSRILRGQPCRNMDDLPVPDYTEYFVQRQEFLPEAVYAGDDLCWLPLEGSRGCWWGEKHHCTFCGINGEGMDFRQKTPDRLIAELAEVTGRHGLKRVCMTDNIMPHRFFQTFLPRLGKELPDLFLFYEQKANLNLDQVVRLKESGVGIIQPGIEALSTPLLKHMDKGLTARQSLLALRYARSVDLSMNWNLLYGFPGDDSAWYEETLRLIPFLTHLQPPSDLCTLSIDRFSPYFFNSLKYGIRSLTPMDSYASVLPDWADIPKIAYHFQGDYDSGSLANGPLVKALQAAVAKWKAAWAASSEDEPPRLSIAWLAEDSFILADTRGIHENDSIHFVDSQQALACLIARPMRTADSVCEWAQSRGYALCVDNWHVPLATAVPEVLSQFERAAAEAWNTSRDANPDSRTLVQIGATMSAPAAAE